MARTHNYDEITLLRLRKSEADWLSSGLVDQSAVIGLQNAVRRELMQMPEVAEHMIEEIFLFGAHIRKVFDERTNITLTRFELPRQAIGERAYLIFLAGFLRYSFDFAMALGTRSREEYPSLLDSLRIERAMRGIQRHR